MRILTTCDPFLDTTKHHDDRGRWPARWVGHPKVSGDTPAVMAYRLRFEVPAAAILRIHVSADNRYELFVDGVRIGRGPERGDPENWFYETYDLDLSAGPHGIVARTWWAGELAPAAQMSVRPAFLLAGEGPAQDLLSTGIAPWDCKLLGGYELVRPQVSSTYCVVGARTNIDGRQYDWGFDRGQGDGWEPVRAIQHAYSAASYISPPAGWLLRPATLGPMLDRPIRVGTARHVHQVASDQTGDLRVRGEEHLPGEAAAWDAMLAGRGVVTVPAGTMRRVIIDWGDYYCGYPQLTLSGGRGASVRLMFAEALIGEATDGRHRWSKGNRDQIEGKRFEGLGDRFIADGGAGRVFAPLWWEAGRYVEVLVTTADQPLTIDGLALIETRYPYEFTDRFEASDSRLATVIPLARRVLEMCSHETYMDCPYYEQLMYVGDTRLEVLATYCMTADDRLPRKAIVTFDRSRLPEGLTQSRFPSHARQIIAPFSMWWVCLVHDYAIWRGDMGLVRQMMPGVRAVIDAFGLYVNDRGLIQGPRGWNYVDWVPGWQHGMPADANTGASGIINWQYVLACNAAAALETIVGEEDLARRQAGIAARTAAAIDATMWDEARGLYADDLSHDHYSEHSQCLALISGRVPSSKRDRLIAGLLDAPDLARTTVYFTHYLFEAYRLIGRMDRFMQRMQLWFDMPGQGFKTTLESPEPSRSDCHAWGAHPVYHYYASVLGIRPAAPGFAKVRIEPQLAHLTWARGRLPHPQGFIEADLAIRDGRLTGTISLPGTVSGELVAGGKTVALHPGRQAI